YGIGGRSGVSLAPLLATKVGLLPRLSRQLKWRGPHSLLGHARIVRTRIPRTLRVLALQQGCIHRAALMGIRCCCIGLFRMVWCSYQNGGASSCCDPAHGSFLVLCPKADAC